MMENLRLFGFAGANNKTTSKLEAFYGMRLVITYASSPSE